MSTTVAPYVHDCDECVFVGWHTETGRSGGRLVNIYVHRHPSGFDSLLIRYGNEPSDYTSLTIPAAHAPKRDAHPLTIADGLFG